MASKIKDYLNSVEMDELMLLGYIQDCSMYYLENWKKRGNLTKEEETAAKYMRTYSQKFYKTVLDRLDTKAVVAILKRLEKYNIKVIDRYTEKKLNGEIESKLKIVHMEREQFEDWCCEIMDVKCKNCKAHWGKCSLHELFLENFVDESGENLLNCRYAYTKE